ncbi:MAG: hypothetical protein L0H96_05240, partial [Humibacillus sp.]|nr:hypothetical protein [Humibacillus sp.]
MTPADGTHDVTPGAGPEPDADQATGTQSPTEGAGRHPAGTPAGAAGPEEGEGGGQKPRRP